MTYPYSIGAAASVTGTLAVTSGTGLVVGTGTSFTTQFSTGDVLVVGTERKVVFSVTDDTHMAVTPNWAATASGLTATRYVMQQLDEDLGIPAPKGILVPYSQPIDLADGSLRGGGWITAEWQWGFLWQTDRDVLRTYCPGASAQVAIYTRTPDNADAYAYYLAQMLWPQVEDRVATRRLSFNLKFRALLGLV